MDNNIFYMVSFAETGQTFFYSTHEHAVMFVLQKYLDKYKNSSLPIATIWQDLYALQVDGCIEDFAWIDECAFED